MTKRAAAASADQIALVSPQAPAAILEQLQTRFDEAAGEARQAEEQAIPTSPGASTTELQKPFLFRGRAEAYADAAKELQFALQEALQP